MAKCCKNANNVKLDDADKSIEIREDNNTISQIYNNVWPLISIALGITIIVLLIIAIVRASKASDHEKYDDNKSCDSSCEDSECDCN